MSANTSITEGGKARPFGPVKALMVQGSDGKYYPWFPESDRALGTLSVDKNGIYKASDKGVYEWSSVSVNVPTSEGVTGKDPDTGEEVYVHPDPSGELVKDVLPVEIRVIEPPTNPNGTYVDGQTITKDGMVVKAYGANGDEMLTVPIAEIMLNPTTAVYDESSAGELIIPTDYITTGKVKVTSVGSIHAAIALAARHIPTPYIDAGGLTYLFNETFEYDGKNPAIVTSNISNASYINGGYGPLAVTLFPNVEIGDEIDLGKYFDVTPEIDTQGKREYVGGALTLTPGGKYYAYNGLFIGENSDQYQYKVSTLNAIYINGFPQTITVSWPRPGDGAVLETTFDIIVGPHGGTGDD